MEILKKPMKTKKETTASEKNPIKSEMAAETVSNNPTSAMEQFIKDKTGDDKNISKHISNMGLAVNKNTKKTDKLTSKHTFAHSKVDRSRYITKK